MRSQEKEVEWNVLDGCFAGLGLLMLGVWDPGAVPQLLRGVLCSIVRIAITASMQRALFRSV
jgi:hypothetical protein